MEFLIVSELFERFFKGHPNILVFSLGFSFSQVDMARILDQLADEEM